MASAAPHRQILKDSATLSALEDALVQSGDPLELSAVDPEELIGLRALVELVVFTWRAESSSIYKRLRKAGGCKAYMTEEVDPVLATLPGKLREDVQAVGPVRSNNPSAWRKAVISVIVRHGFPEAILNELQTVHDSASKRHPAPKGEQGGDDAADTASKGQPAPKGEQGSDDAAAAPPAPAAERAARVARLAGRLSRMGKGRRPPAKRGAAAKARDVSPLHRLKRALKDQLSDGPKPLRRLALKGIVDGMDADALASATDMCLQLNSQLAQVLTLCFSRQSEKAKEAAAAEGAAA